MLSRKDATQKYISIKEEKQNKYDNNVTIIIYNEIKLHSESSSSNLTWANIYSQHAHMACIRIHSVILYIYIYCFI